MQHPNRGLSRWESNRRKEVSRRAAMPAAVSRGAAMPMERRISRVGRKGEAISLPRVPKKMTL
jgi:hypothetical protein